jgi:serine/threonine protein kinase
VKVGPYEVLSELGRGGMGAVYRVRAFDGQEHALKVLFRSDADALTRFDRERRLLASLGEKTGFVGLLGAGTTPEGSFWLLMPLVPGGTLRTKLLGGPLGVEETIALGERLATALGQAHERGIVHRDMKPENVLFTASREPLIADLGLAKHFDRSTPGARQSVALTADGRSAIRETAPRTTTAATATRRGARRLPPGRRARASSAPSRNRAPGSDARARSRTASSQGGAFSPSGSTFPEPMLVRTS